MECVASLVSVILIVGINTGMTVPTDSVKVRSGYADSLNQVVKLFKENRSPSISLLNYSLPENEEEAHLFFQLDYKKESEVEFAKLLKFAERLCIEGQETTLKKFIPLSQFVDGYFAEDYFHSAERICKSNRKQFCRVFDSIDIKKKQRLVDYGITCK